MITEKENLIEAKQVAYATPGGRPLQRNLSFSLKSTQLLLISGSNGTGKSTLLRALLGLGSINRGTLSCHVAREKIQFIPQLENTEVHLPLTLGDVLAISNRTVPDPREVLELGLLTEAHLSASWNTASGGERKRTLLTRALLKNPALLVFDEPFNHLDEVSRQAMTKAMERFLSQNGCPKGIVMVSHQSFTSKDMKVVRVNLDDSKEATTC